MEGHEHRHKRGVLADARFQLKYTVMIVAASVALLAAVGALYVRTLAEQRQLVGINRICLGQPPAVATDADREFDAEVATRLEAADTRSTLLLAVAAALLVTAVAAMALRLTFHIVGPARAVSAMLRRIAAGDLPAPRHLRRADEFRFLETDLEHLVDTLARDGAADAALLGEAAAALRASGRPDAEDLAQRLEQRAATRVAGRDL